jgi:hypothetical protein
MSRHNPEPAIDRLRKRIVIDPDTGCHNWTGANTLGYGSIGISFGGKKQKLSTHRLAYEAERGPIPAGLVLDHLCRNPACCNPDHLEPVTQKENMRRGSFGSRTHCKHGHEYTPENTYLLARGRQCRECRRLAVAARRKPKPPSIRGPISTHKIDEVRLWLARQLMDSRLSADEALGVVAHHPAVSSHYSRDTSEDGLVRDEPSSPTQEGADANAGAGDTGGRG